MEDILDEMEEEDPEMEVDYHEFVRLHTGLVMGIKNDSVLAALLGILWKVSSTAAQHTGVAGQTVIRSRLKGGKKPSSIAPYATQQPPEAHPPPPLEPPSPQEVYGTPVKKGPPNALGPSSPSHSDILDSPGRCTWTRQDSEAASILVANLVARVRRAVCARGLRGLIHFRSELHLPESVSSKTMLVPVDEIEQLLCAYCGVSTKDMELLNKSYGAAPSHDLGEDAIDVKSFFDGLRLKLSRSKRSKVDECYANLRRAMVDSSAPTGDLGRVHELARLYVASRHPQVLSGEITSGQALQDFEDGMAFCCAEHARACEAKDTVTPAAFHQYYEYLNMCYDDDGARFSEVLKNTWAGWQWHNLSQVWIEPEPVLPRVENSSTTTTTRAVERPDRELAPKGCSEKQSIDIPQPLRTGRKVGLGPAAKNSRAGMPPWIPDDTDSKGSGCSVHSTCDVAYVQRRRRLTGRSTIVSSGTGAKILMSGGKRIQVQGGDRRTDRDGAWGPTGPTIDDRSRHARGCGSSASRYEKKISALHSSFEFGW